MDHKVIEAERVITEDGWHLVAQRGSHRHYRHSTKPGKVTIPSADRDSLHPKTWQSILRQAGLEDS